jgi:hypothetical protein
MLKYTLFLLVATLLIAACVQEITFDPEKNVSDTIVVSGNFTNSQGAHRLFLTRPNTFGNASFVAVKDAQVWIVEVGGQRAQYVPRTAQTVIDPDFCYELAAGALVGEPGKAYFVEILLADGRLYRSQAAVMPAQMLQDSLYTLGSIYNPGTSSSAGNDIPYVVLDAHVSVPDDGQTYFARWDVFRVFHLQEFYRDPVPPKTQTFCYVHDFFNKQRVYIQKFENVGGQSFNRKIGQIEVDRTFEVLNYFTALRYSITEDAYRYWSQIEQVANPGGTVFDAPPSPVRGNIYPVNAAEEVPLGYFEVATVDTMRRRLITTELGSLFAAPRYCEYAYPNYTAPGPECFCCELLPFSMYKKPWYWKD